MLQVRQFKFTIVKCDPLSKNLALHALNELSYRRFYLYRSFPRLLHQRVTGAFHCIILNYKARLYYYKEAVSLISQAGQ